MLLGEGRPPTGRQYCLVHRASRAKSEVSRWSLGCGKSSGTDERPGQQGFGTTCQGVPAVGLDRQTGVCLAVCEHECVCVCVCVCMHARVCASH